MKRRVPSAKQAVDFVKTHGVVLESSHGSVPTFVDFVAGERVQRWWSHPLGRSIFRLTRALRDSREIVTCRLIDGKITYVHRRVWPALVRLSETISKQDLAAIREEHLPSGKHRVTKTPFPDWVPSNVMRLGGELSEAEAKSLLACIGVVDTTNGGS